MKDARKVKRWQMKDGMKYKRTLYEGRQESEENAR
jgi:hypothetical protein